MTDNSIGIAFIIPHREEEPVLVTVQAAVQAAEANNISFTVITVSGNQPSFQRNRASEMTDKPYLYFLDNDAYITAESLQHALTALQVNNDTGIIGGPSLAPDTASPKQKAAQAVFSSPIAVGKIASRYRSSGALRQCDDRELILCNMLVSANLFRTCGGFNELLYPNEENDFIHRALAAGAKVMHHPCMAAYREPRPTVHSFIMQVYTYGRGRGEQCRINPSSFHPALLIPALFSIYIVPAVILSFFFPAVCMPVILWLFLAWISACVYRIKNKTPFLYFGLYFMINHLIYGWGLCRGIFTRTYRSRHVEPYANPVKAAGDGPAAKTGSGR